MEKEPSFFEKANNWVKNSITIRLITIGILIILLLIPVTKGLDYNLKPFLLLLLLK